jgi:crotonobetainyl-CoA:carnitine CoA-transferase CaiB-like acyl-CoA transferase
MADRAPPLAGLRVVESTRTLAGSYAGFLLAGLGADVVRVEERGAAHTPGDRVLHRGKRSLTLGTAEPLPWGALVDGADVVLVDEHAPQVTTDAGLVACRISAADDDTPWDEALLAARSGVQGMQWSWAKRPVWLVTPMIAYMGGLLGALGVVAASVARRRGGPGQRVEVRGLDAAMALNSGTYVWGEGHQGSLSQYGDPRGVYPNYSLYRTADGWLFVGALTPAFWVKFVTALERVDLLADERLQGNPLTFGAPETKDFVRRELDPIFATRPTAEWLRVLGEADVPCGPVQTRTQALGDAEARALGMVAALDDPLLGPTWQPGEPALFSDTPAPTPRPASLPGADTATLASEVQAWRRAPLSPAPRPSAGCLEGMRVLDLASFIAGPFCPLLLADLGADVVKIESPEGDPFRMAAFAFVGWNRGKRSLVLDLKRSEGREVFLDLVRGADVVVDNFRPGVMERLGIGWATLAGVNPRLVHTSITGYGRVGPLAARPGFDPVFQARGGLAQAQGGTDDPVMHMIAYNDYAAGALGALATVTALFARERTGRGQRVDVSLFRTAYLAQAADMILHDGGAPPVAGGRDHVGPSAGRRIYACRDGALCVAVTTRAEAAALGRLVGVALDLEDAPDGAAAAAVSSVLAALARDAALARLAAAGVPAAPCLGFDEICSDAQLRASGCIHESVDPMLGRLRLTGPFVRFSQTAAVPRRSAPSLGGDGPDVLRELGYDDARIATLFGSGVAGHPA